MSSSEIGWTSGRMADVSLCITSAHVKTVVYGEFSSLRETMRRHLSFNKGVKLDHKWKSFISSSSTKRSDKPRNDFNVLVEALVSGSCAAVRIERCTMHTIESDVSVSLV
jgi:hypothetical protein